MDKMKADHLGHLVFIEMTFNGIPHVDMKFLKSVGFCEN